MLVIERNEHLLYFRDQLAYSHQIHEGAQGIQSEELKE